ncbi:hypothetical protein AMAG_05435 [Allomyces macrogynus ATCC 38327]|uniref:Dpy-30 domain-containing protein n=1 Tax=Allomyces macrogynus (strain ATCC 38327) TaxID=578462 RepID=A0A0L0SC33_ALLM3|nr:hypothetical protein AMAG_05435 [Allomyces macrogynus ATCC 38327]|eukprot:KNE59992.1 hypothetical protein AMAG_05435 [Allomyces macrogynus ATCC 38327]
MNVRLLYHGNGVVECAIDGRLEECWQGECKLQALTLPVANRRKPTLLIILNAHLRPSQTLSKLAKWAEANSTDAIFKMESTAANDAMQVDVLPQEHRDAAGVSDLPNAAPVPADHPFGVEIQTVEDIYEQEKRGILEANKDFLQGLPVRSYLDQTVVPILLEGMKALVRERPPNPCEYLGLFLVKNASKVDKPPAQDTAAASSSSAAVNPVPAAGSVPGSATAAAPSVM